MKNSVFTIEAMDCPTEEQIILNRFKGVPEVEDLGFDLMNRRLTVKHRFPDDAPLVAALSQIGMRPEEALPQSPSDQVSGKGDKGERRRLGIALALALGSEAASFAMNSEQNWPVIAMAVAAVALGGEKTFRKGIAAIRTLTLNINFLMAIAIVGAIAIGEWPEAAVVTVLFGIAEMIEGYSLDRARNAIRGLMAMAPDKATVRDTSGNWVEMDAGAVNLDAMARVRPGDRIPFDGEVVSGESTVDQASITGESLPVEKKAGDKVFAGTINHEGVLEFRVTANRGNTTLDRIIRTVQEAQASRAPTQRFVDAFARVYTPIVVLLALLMAGIPSLMFAEPFLPWLYKALVLLVIACPCALVISTPVTVVSGLASAARQGILIKGGVHLETGRKLKIIALDKTGTLTNGKPVVTDFYALHDRESESAKRIAASLDALSDHPVARAVSAYWTGERLQVEGFRALFGRGVQGRLAAQLDPIGASTDPVGALTDLSGAPSDLSGASSNARGASTMYFVGNHKLAEENGVCCDHVHEVLFGLEKQGKTAVVLTDEREALAVFGVQDTLRDTSIEALKELHGLGVRTLMLTGDNEVTAKRIAEMAGIDEVRAELSPDEKLTAIEELQRGDGHVGMIGDGVNDAPALAKAEIGFAMGAAGTDTALETADVALMQDDLRKVSQFIRLSRKTSAVLTQNIAIALGIKVVFFGLAFFGIATLWMAVFADMGASLIVVGNGLRLLKPAAEQGK